MGFRFFVSGDPLLLTSNNLQACLVLPLAFVGFRRKKLPYATERGVRGCALPDRLYHI